MQTTKERILSAVIEYIKDDTNLESITLSKIAEKAQIGKSTVYEHFASKEDLIIETYQYLLEHYRSILTKDLSGLSFKDQFIEQVKHILVVMMDAKTIIDGIMNNKDTLANIGKTIEDKVKCIQDEMEQRFLSIFTKGVEEGVVPLQQPKPYQPNVIQAIISGLLYQYANGMMTIEKEVLYELVYENVLMVIKCRQKVDF
ncbi:MAG: TetR/AcrR family transcriptional regulator [Acholeplasmataceae bacterium]|jgi:AcrR family transcriptional regulator|nr:TetR/AcrR family transcriptional regulator [Acholeplasmataceae bacterium]